MKRFMPVIDVQTERAVSRYERGLAFKGGQVRLDGRLGAQVNNYRSYREHMFQIDYQVREMVATARVPQVHLFAYMRFARRVDRVHRTERAEARFGLVQYEVERAVVQGLARELLLRICREVFEIDPQRFNPSDREGVSAEESRPSSGVEPTPERGSDQSQTPRD